MRIGGSRRTTLLTHEEEMGMSDTGMFKLACAKLSPNPTETIHFERLEDGSGWRVTCHEAVIPHIDEMKSKVRRVDA